MDRNVTIKDVARKAGVGIATVSRVLNNSERVDPNTRAKVLAVIRKLAYRPNAQGRRLVKRASEMVCFILSNRDFINPFHSGILYGAERFLNQSGHDVIFSNLYYPAGTPAEDLSLPRILTHRGIADGVILSGTVHANLIEAIRLLAVPCVFFGNNIISDRPEERHMEAMDSVYFEEASAARSETELLVRLGHRHIWFIGDARMPWFQRRLHAFREVLVAAGLEPHEYTAPWLGSERDYGVLYGEHAIEQVLGAGRPVTAVFAGNDGIAFGIWKALQRRGMRMAQDISVVGFDDVQEARLTEPPLTTVHVPNEQIGAECAAMLLQKLRERGRPQPPRVIPTYVIERASCGPAPGAKGQTSAD